ncbi:MAG: hypothetical protein OHK0046_13260 [Anaerolineae bacterium]
MTRRFFALALVALLLLVSSAVVQAAENDNLNWAVGCEGFTSVSGGFRLDRDNTGNGFETYTITATDGQGNLIFGPFTGTSFVGFGVFINPGQTFLWSRQPISNPLTVTVTSPAGNGLPSETVYTVSGNCDELALITLPEVVDETDANRFFLGVLTLQELLALLDVSPSVPLNANPPRPNINRGELRGTAPGYVIVDRLTANIRSGAGTEYTVVAQVDASTELNVLGRNDDRSWWFVEVDGIRGWINAELVVIVGDLTNVPVVPSVGEIFPPRFYVFRTQDTFLTPSEGAPVACPVSGDREYIIAGQSSNGEWIALATACNNTPVIGWISAASGAIRNSGDLSIPVIPG